MRVHDNALSKLTLLHALLVPTCAGRCSQRKTAAFQSAPASARCAPSQSSQSCEWSAHSMHARVLGATKHAQQGETHTHTHPTAAPCACCVWRLLAPLRCISCGRAKPYSPDCEYCAQEPTVARSSACFACANTPPPRGTRQPFCASCLSLPSPERQQQCLACLSDAATPEPAKQFCVGCTSWFARSNASTAACLDCLRRTGPTDEGGTRNCSRAAAVNGSRADAGGVLLLGQ